ncbi:hypothetical protein [Clostridium vincentii]|nr:hypothetical protein [Clostridium vincentii]
MSLTFVYFGIHPKTFLAFSLEAINCAGFAALLSPKTTLISPL